MLAGVRYALVVGGAGNSKPGFFSPGEMEVSVSLSRTCMTWLCRYSEDQLADANWSGSTREDGEDKGYK